MSIRLGIFLGALMLASIANARQVYRQTTTDVETRDSGKTVGDIIKTTAERMRPQIPVEVISTEDDGGPALVKNTT